MTNCISSLLWISHVCWSLFHEKGKRLWCVYNVSARWTVNMDKFTLFVYCNFLVLLSTTVLSKNINKQNVNIADETLTDYSFLSMYHYNKSKNYLKRRYRIRHWIPMFIGTPLYKTNSQHYLQNLSRKKWGKIFWLFILANCNIKRTPQIIQLRYQVYCYGRLSESPFRLFDTNTYNL